MNKKTAAKSKYDFAKEGKISNQGNPFLEGDHVVEVVKCLDISGFYGNSFIAECKVLESDTMRPGQVAGFKVNLDKKEMAANALLTFVAAAMGFGAADKDEIDDNVRPNIGEILEEAVAENGLAGMTLRVRAVRAESKAGQTYTKLTPSPV